jgi:hypothetical protein
VNGETVLVEQSTVPVCDRGFVFGDSVDIDRLLEIRRLCRKAGGWLTRGGNSG